MNWKLVERITAGAVFLFALFLYLSTVAPTVSFWDPGERIAVSHGLQIPHPPGAPFYMLVGRVASAFMPGDLVALSINMVSVLSSAFTVLLAFLIILHLIREWKGPRATWDTSTRIAAYAGGVIGALTIAVSDSFWFNAVEAETYALSTFFTALCVWLALKWSEVAQHSDILRASGVQTAFGEHAERWLLVIAYLYGLAIGVHLLSLLSLFFVALIVFFRRFDRPEWTSGERFRWLVVTGVIAAAVFLLLYPGIIQYLPEFMGSSGAPVLFVVGLIAVLAFALYYTQARRLRRANMLAIYIMLALIGYSSYALIPIRSATDPPIDQNNPETLDAFVSYMGREQYGARPLLIGDTYNNRTGQIEEDNPQLFPRRYSNLSPSHLSVYAQFSSDLDFFLRYQLGHMYGRYFMWNFVGRESDIQDAPWMTGISFIDRVPDRVMQTPSERNSRNVYYGLPLLLGLIGMIFHFKADWRRFFAVGVLFFMTGIAIVFYLNQTPLQPRERDYSYAGSFFAFSLWIGLGATGIIYWAREAMRDAVSGTLRNSILLSIGGVLLLAVPGLMLSQNYFSHDRSGNYVANDYAYNMLMSLDENAIVFTNGDNDTFPLWYLQEVEGVRRDVRVVNLSLLQTPWYVRQLRDHAARDSAPLPISLTDEQIEQLRPQGWDPAQVALPVDPEEIAQNIPIPEDDLARLESPMRWTLEGRPFNQDVRFLNTADLVVYDMLSTNAENGWERPIYFAITVAPDSWLNLESYFQLEGKAFRVVPIRHDVPMYGRVVPEVTPERMHNFRLRRVNDPDVYFDENIRRMLDNYRRIYAHTAEGLVDSGHSDTARVLLDDLMEMMPYETIPGNEGSYIFMARAYQLLGDDEMVVNLLQRAEPVVLQSLATARTQSDQQYAARMVEVLRYTYLDTGAYEQAAAFSNRLADLLNDDSFRESAEELRDQHESAVEADTTIPPPSDLESMP